MLSLSTLSTLATVPVAARAAGPITDLHDGPFHGGFGFLFLLIPLFWIGLIVLVVSLLGRRFRRRGFGPGGSAPWASGHAATRSAESTLAERFAQGDIEEKEYRARLEVLRANRGEPSSQ